jgi:predicted oxidoreductase
MMQTLQLGVNGPRLSRLLYGVWRLSESPDISPAATIRKIEACLAQGITSFDHADIYGNYSCEQLFGAALALAPHLKRQIQIVTKCDIMLKSSVYPQRRVKYYDTSASHIQASVDASLRHLGVETIDLLLLHRPDPLMDHRETGRCLDDLVSAGKVRAVGVSNFKPWDCELLQSGMRERLVANQIEMSLLAQDAFIDGSLAFAQRTGLSTMAWSPLAGGALFGESAGAQRLQPKLQALADAAGVGTDAVALAWLLAHPAGILPVVGTNSEARVARLSDCFKVQIDRPTWFELYEAGSGHEVP